MGPTLTLNALFHLAVVETDETLELLNRVDNCLHKIPSLDLMISVRIPDCEEYYELFEAMETIFGWDVELVDPIDFEWMTDDEEDEDGYEDEDGDEDDEDDDDDAFDDSEASDNDHSAGHDGDGDDDSQNGEKDEIDNGREGA